ncbi:MAG: hypothetical protein IT452_07120 [Planctomycetia bacterium]|nr:hypothetical protein [Planctomycetia bacterium]
MLRRLAAVVLPALLASCASPGDRVRDYRDRMALGDRKMEHGDAPGAVRAFEGALELEPRSAWAWFRLGEAKRALGDDSGAAAAFRRASELNLDEAKEWFHSGQRKQAAGDHDGAILDCTRALAIRTAPEFHRARGHARLCANDLDGARADLEEAAIARATGPGADFTQLELAAARLVSGRRGEALQGLQRHFRQSHPTPETAWPHQVAKFLLGELPEPDLILTARTGEGRPRDERCCEAAFYAGVARLAAGDEDGALERLRECAAAEIPEFVEPPMARALVKRLETGR